MVSCTKMSSFDIFLVKNRKTLCHLTGKIEETTHFTSKNGCIQGQKSICSQHLPHMGLILWATMTFFVFGSIAKPSATVAPDAQRRCQLSRTCAGNARRRQLTCCRLCAPACRCGVPKLSVPLGYTSLAYCLNPT